MPNAKTTYLVHEDGTLEVKNFKARTFEVALKAALTKGWDKKPAVLAQVLRVSPDILTVLIGIMNSFAEFLWDERAKVEARIAKRTEKLEKACAKEPFDAATIRKDNELKLLYKQLNFFDERLWALEEKAPEVWLEKLPKIEFNAIVEGLKEFLKAEVTDAWIAFNPSFDSAQGRAVEDMRLLPADLIDALDLRFFEAEGVSLPLAVATDLTVAEANKVARAAKLDIAFLAVKSKGKKATEKK